MLKIPWARSPVCHRSLLLMLARENPKALFAKFLLLKEPSLGIALIHRTRNILLADLNEAPRIAVVLPRKGKERDRTIRKSSKRTMTDSPKTGVKDQSLEEIPINIPLNRP